MDHDRDLHHPLLEGKEAPPPGVRAMAVVRWLMLAGVAAAALFSATTSAALFRRHEGAVAPHAHYACPMHPQITSDRPGECPICHMSLELVERTPPPAPPVPSAPSASAAPRPPAPPGPPSAGRGAEPAEAASAPVATPPGPPPDTTPITLSLDRVQAIGVRTALVEKSLSTEALRVTAAVEVPERGRAEVHVRVPGTVEAIHVRDTGEKVKAGQPLVSVYSPEIFQAEQELLAMGAWASPAGGPALPAPPTASARRKLELLGMSRETIDRVVASGQPVRAVAVTSPIDGYVTHKDVVLGSYAMPDKVLFEIADLRRVYIVASLYPQQIAGVHPGDEAVFSTPSLPGRGFTARIDTVYPEIDLATRTARLRFRVDNGDLALRPGQTGVANRGRRAEALTIPMDAVIDTGRSVYVFLAQEGGRFEARAVVLGAQVGDRFVVEAGLAEGDRVVSGATFLIDAESRLQASLAAGGAR